MTDCLAQDTFGEQLQIWLNERIFVSNVYVVSSQVMPVGVAAEVMDVIDTFLSSDE